MILNRASGISVLKRWKNYQAKDWGTQTAASGTSSVQLIWDLHQTPLYAAVNGHLELPLLKDRQRFDTVSTSNLEVYKFRDWWILTYFIFGHCESSLNNIWSMVNLERMCILLFYYFLCLKANLDLEKTNQLGESSPNFIFTVVNLDPIILEKRWIDGESWSNDFVEKVNRGEDLRWVGSGCPLTYALVFTLLRAHLSCPQWQRTIHNCSSNHQMQPKHYQHSLLRNDFLCNSTVYLVMCSYR